MSIVLQSRKDEKPAYGSKTNTGFHAGTADALSKSLWATLNRMKASMAAAEASASQTSSTSAQVDPRHQPLLTLVQAARENSSQLQHVYGHVLRSVAQNGVKLGLPGDLIRVLTAVCEQCDETAKKVSVLCEQVQCRAERDWSDAYLKQRQMELEQTYKVDLAVMKATLQTLEDEAIRFEQPLEDAKIALSKMCHGVSRASDQLSEDALAEKNSRSGGLLIRPPAASARARTAKRLTPVKLRALFPDIGFQNTLVNEREMFLLDLAADAHEVRISLEQLDQKQQELFAQENGLQEHTSLLHGSLLASSLGPAMYLPPDPNNFVSAIVYHLPASFHPFMTGLIPHENLRKIAVMSTKGTSCANLMLTCDDLRLNMTAPDRDDFAGHNRVFDRIVIQVTGKGYKTKSFNLHTTIDKKAPSVEEFVHALDLMEREETTQLTVYDKMASLHMFACNLAAAPALPPPISKETVATQTEVPTVIARSVLKLKRHPIFDMFVSPVTPLHTAMLLTRRTTLKIMAQIWADRWLGQNEQHQQGQHQVHRANMMRPRPFYQFVYAHFIERYGLPKLAERHLSEFMRSLQEYALDTPRVHMFCQFFGMLEPARSHLELSCYTRIVGLTHKHAACNSVRIDEEESQAVITRFVAQKALSELWAHFPADLLASSIENCVQACETSADDKLIVPRPSMKSANAMTIECDVFWERVVNVCQEARATTELHLKSLFDACVSTINPFGAETETSIGGCVTSPKDSAAVSDWSLYDIQQRQRSADGLKASQLDAVVIPKSIFETVLQEQGSSWFAHAFTDHEIARIWNVLPEPCRKTAEVTLPALQTAPVQMKFEPYLIHVNLAVRRNNRMLSANVQRRRAASVIL